jgi:hypothetical protein
MMNTKTKMAHYIAKAHAENTLPVITNGSVDIAYGVGATVGIAMVLNDWADAEKAHADRINEQGQYWANMQSYIRSAARLDGRVKWSELPHTIEQRVDAHHKFVDDIKKHVDCTTDVLDEIVMHVRGLVKAEEHSQQRIKELESRLAEAVANPVNWDVLEGGLRAEIAAKQKIIEGYKSCTQAQREQLKLGEFSTANEIAPAIAKLRRDELNARIERNEYESVIERLRKTLGLTDSASFEHILKRADDLRVHCANQENELDEYHNVMAESRKHLGLAEDADGTDILTAIEKTVAAN